MAGVHTPTSAWPMHDALAAIPLVPGMKGFTRIDSFSGARPTGAGVLQCGGRGPPLVEGAPERLEGYLRELRWRAVLQWAPRAAPIHVFVEESEAHVHEVRVEHPGQPDPDNVAPQPSRLRRLVIQVIVSPKVPWVG